MTDLGIPQMGDYSKTNLHRVRSSLVEIDRQLEDELQKEDEEIRLGERVD